MRAAVLPLLVLAALVPASAAGQGQTRVTGWGGANPFACTVQQAGFGTDVPDPKADPYCVEFDKRRQNVTELGIADFLGKEPARVAAALDKCFYFQSDHWRASVVQDDAATKLYEWDGHYFFDKARGEGGVWVTNFNVNGRTEDPSRIPGIPPEFAQHMGPGTGGVRVVDGSIPLDPACAERAAREPERIYADAARRAAGEDPGGFATVPAQDPERCRVPRAGRVTSRALGPVALGATERQVRAALGAPAEIRRGFLRYCDGGSFLVGQAGDRSGDLGVDDDAPTVIAIATRGAFRLRGVGPGRRAPRRWRTVARAGDLRLVAPRRSSPVVAGVRGGRVRLIAVYDRRAIRTARALAAYVRRAAV